MLTGDAERMVNGVAASLIKSSVAQCIFKVMLRSYFYVTHRWTVGLYEEFLEGWRDFPITAASILYFSGGNDPMCDVSYLRTVISLQRDSSCCVWEKHWEISGHAQHFILHRKEYESKLVEFLMMIDGRNPAFLKYFSPNL